MSSTRPFPRSHSGRSLSRRAGWLIGGCLMLAGCMSDPAVAPVVAEAKTTPNKTISSFTSSLQCMDTLLWQHGKSDIYIMTSGIPDATGKVAAGRLQGN